MKNSTNKNKGKSNPTKARSRRRAASRVKVAPVALSTKTKSKAPNVRTDNKSTVVTHREILRENVTNSATFSVLETYAVQPAITTNSRGSPLGTWLPGIASQYDNYEFLSLKLHYYTSASSLTSGTLVMSYDPNPDGIAPTSFSIMRNSAVCVNGAVRENLVLDVSDRVRGRKLLTRTSAVTAYGLYDAGRLYIATTGGADSASIGYVEAEYTVRLSNPQTAPNTESDLVYEPVLPQVLMRSNLPAYAYNVATNSIGPTQDMLASAITVADPGYVDTVLNTFVDSNQSGYNGCKYAVVAGSRTVLRFIKPGRYRVKVQINGDWEDLKLFCFNMFACDGATVSPLYSKTATGLSHQTLDTCIRGFTGVVTGDPNPGTDLQLGGEWDINVPTANYKVVPMIGVRDYNSVSTSSATYNARGGTGPSYLFFRYLGPPA